MNERNNKWHVWQDEILGEWSAIDAKTRKIYKLSDELGNTLYRFHNLWNMPFEIALKKCKGTNKNDKFFIDLELLGSRIRVASKFPAILEFIKNETENIVSSNKCSAEVVIEIFNKSGIERVLRAMDDGGNVRKGAIWRNAWSKKWQTFDSGIPLVPPFSAEVYNNRFLCLHAAILAIDSTNGIIICGERGSGKTTSALLATKEPSCMLLSDEVTLIEHRTLNAFGVPLPIGVYDVNGNKKRVNPLKFMPINNSAIKPAIVIVLAKSSEAGYKEIINTSEAIQSILPHLRNIGTEITSDFLTLKRLIKTTKVFELKVTKWPELYSELDINLNSILKACR